MKRATKKLASVTQEADSQELVLSITKGRQEIESGIFRIQFRNSTMHLVEKSWYTAWMAFISGKYAGTILLDYNLTFKKKNIGQSTDIPGAVNNENLLLSDGLLNPTLSLGKDFELIGNLSRWYIERIYGVSGKIISSSKFFTSNINHPSHVTDTHIR